MLISLIIYAILSYEFVEISNKEYHDIPGLAMQPYHIQNACQVTFSDHRKVNLMCFHLETIINSGSRMHMYRP